jgi:5'-nucleotidase (lipoprotein e(P4) family)
MTTKRIYGLLTLLVITSGILISCNTKPDLIETTNNDHLITATLFQQFAAEKRALSYQAYNIARIMLDNELKNDRLTKKLAVVVDIDETVLDNSPFEAKCIQENTDYPKYWKEWCDKASARPISGAIEFLNYAKSQGVDVFYITNRKSSLMSVTLHNLQHFGFPFADTNYILMRTDSSDKESRRQFVESDHRIALLIGDNLGDFSHEFDGKSTKDRFSMTDSLRYEFGNRFIMLPNPMYGSWVSALMKNESDLSKKEKVKKFRNLLKSF